MELNKNIWCLMKVKHLQFNKMHNILFGVGFSNLLSYYISEIKENKLLFCVLYDLGDIPMIVLNAATFGIAGAIYDVIGTYYVYKWFGYEGLLNIWEIAEITNTIESFIPTMTITYFIHKYKK